MVNLESASVLMTSHSYQ